MSDTPERTAERTADLQSLERLERQYVDLLLAGIASVPPIS